MHKSTYYFSFLKASKNFVKIEQLKVVGEPSALIQYVYSYSYV